MATVFTRILNGELPARFVWKDPLAVAFLTIQPIRPGHLLVVPRQEIDHWIDLPPELNAHIFGVARTIGQALQQAFQPQKVGLMIAGLEVRHVHLHLLPIESIGDLNFAKADPNATAASLDAAAEKTRAALRALGCAQVSA